MGDLCPLDHAKAILESTPRRVSRFRRDVSWVRGLWSSSRATARLDGKDRSHFPLDVRTSHHRSRYRPANGQVSADQTGQLRDRNVVLLGKIGRRVGFLFARRVDGHSWLSLITQTQPRFVTLSQWEGIVSGWVKPANHGRVRRGYLPSSGNHHFLT